VVLQQLNMPVIQEVVKHLMTELMIAFHLANLLVDLPHQTKKLLDFIMLIGQDIEKLHTHLLPKI
jgi:hypothetical protein